MESVFSKSGQGIYHVRLRGTGRWIKFAPGSSESKAVSEGFHARIADADPKARPIDVAWVENFDLPANLPGDSFVRISPASGLTEAPRVEFGARGPPQGASLTYLDVGDKRTPVHVDPQTGLKFIRYRDIPAELRGNPREIAGLGARGSGMSADTARLKRIIDKRDYTATVREAAADPTGFRSRSDAYLSEQIQLNNEYLARHQFDTALRQMNDTIAFWGSILTSW